MMPIAKDITDLDIGKAFFFVEKVIVFFVEKSQADLLLRFAF